MSEPVIEDACARWIGLADRVALGERLAAADQELHDEHPSTCAACRAEADVWGAMETMLDGPAPPQRSLVVSARRPMRVGVVAVAVLTAFASAAAALLLARQPTQTPVVVNAPSAPLVAPALPVDAHLVLSAAGSVAVDGRPGVVGQALVRGSLLDAHESAACMAIDTGVRACMGRGSLVRVVGLGPERRLELLRGRIAAELDPQPVGTSFGIVTRDGSSVAVGTAFSVEVPEGAAPVITRVLHGTVVVRSATGEEHRVGAHEMIATREPVATSLPSADEARDRALVDGVAEPARVVVVTPPVSSAPTPVQLLAAARERSARGDGKGAAEAYRELVEHRPASPEAHAALVPFGELQLGEQSDPRGALASFDRYLESGGPLDEEASFGRVRALRALRSAVEERAAIDAFLTRFPRSALAGSLRARRSVLEDR